MTKIERVYRKLTDAERERMRAADAELRDELPRLREISQTIPRVTIQLRVTPEIHAALTAWCDSHDTDLSSLLRNEALKKIGRKDLVATMPSPGRPPAAE